MQIQLGAAIAAILLAVVVQPAHAATDSRYQTAQGGVSCKPTDMVVNTGLKAKSTGLRNEGTTAGFVICGFESSNSRSDVGTVLGITMGIYGIGGTVTTVSCTAVNGYAANAPIYAVKNVTTNADGTASLMNFDASDFGGTAGQPLPDTDFWSVTCTLPAKSSIGYMYTKFNVNVPNPPPA